MTDEERATELANMHRCLDAAAKVWKLLGDSFDNRETEVHRDTVMAEIAIIFPTPLAIFRAELIMQCITGIVNSHALTSCGLWEFSHDLMHAIYDEDVPRG